MGRNGRNELPLMHIPLTVSEHLKPKHVPTNLCSGTLETVPPSDTLSPVRKDICPDSYPLYINTDQKSLAALDKYQIMVNLYGGKEQRRKGKNRRTEINFKLINEKQSNRITSNKAWPHHHCC